MKRSQLSNEERYLLKLLRAAFREGQKFSGGKRLWDKCPADLDWDRLLVLAKRHGVLSLLYDVLEDCPRISEEQRRMAELAGHQAVRQSYHLLFLTGAVMKLLEENGIEAVVMKGVTVSACYPVPELRKSGDVDILLLRREDMEKIPQVLGGAGFVLSGEQHANHHQVYCSPDGIELEIHTMLAEAFDNEPTNRFLEHVVRETGGHVTERDVMGLMLPVAEEPYYAFQLLIHMLHHFLRAGFGLKLLCDWALFWNRQVSTEVRDGFFALIRESGLVRFTAMVTMICVRYLGLPSDCVDFLLQWEGEMSLVDLAREFLIDILEAEEFGKSEGNRMVVMRGTAPGDYVREFHHQMRINFPKAGKCPVCWPALWCATLGRFLRNNRTVRNVTARSILREAKQRSARMEQLRLFQSRQERRE